MVSGVLVSLIVGCGGSSQPESQSPGQQTVPPAADGGSAGMHAPVQQAGMNAPVVTGQAGARASEEPSTAAGASGHSAVAGSSAAGSGGGAGAAGAGEAGEGGAGSSAAGSGGAKASTGDCSAPPAADAPVGFATVGGMMNGGGTSMPQMITSFDALKTAVAGDAPATVWIKGSLSGDLTVGSNKSLVGLCGAELHGHVEVSGVSNVIIRNLKIVGYGVGDCSKDPSFDASVGCSSGHDAMSIQRSAHNIWIDHCDFSDGTDGNLDITNAANNVTVSWTKFHYTPRTDNSGNDSTGAAGHRFSNLVGGTDTPTTDDAHALDITWHHDWWADNVVERMPRVRFGKNHLFNDLWSSAQASDCVAAGKQAQIWVEHSVFNGVKNPLELRSADKASANITSMSNTFDMTSGTQDTGGGGPALTSVPYMYTADDTAGVEQAIRDGAGPH